MEVDLSSSGIAYIPGACLLRSWLLSVSRVVWRARTINVLCVCIVGEVCVYELPRRHTVPPRADVQWWQSPPCAALEQYRLDSWFVLQVTPWE